MTSYNYNCQIHILRDVSAAVLITIVKLCACACVFVCVILHLIIDMRRARIPFPHVHLACGSDSCLPLNLLTPNI